jgi:hypothetical protein
MGRLVEAMADTWGHTLSADALLLVVSGKPALATRSQACVGEVPNHIGAAAVCSDRVVNSGAMRR